ncbi:metallophosphoesterase [Candidatus Laterigemmans baculatus]|uniref:metallophosphoesterase n=1 Tax=Candidatus Laterigemmans baculatus TaxID=2770505 RepID=UPI0013DAA3BF|nr:metallophosphoesterase [Candidatus Laterigemmans baculatus]
MSNARPSRPGRLIAIGDVHGHAVALRSLLEWVELEVGDQLVMLGDYVNRGPDSCGVIECLLGLRGACELVSLRGNHEEMMLDARSDRAAMDRWRDMGGWETLYSYGSEGTLRDVPESHWRFLEGCVNSHETNKFLFFHANYDSTLAADAQPASLLRWTSIGECPPQAHQSGKVAILGHEPGEVRDFGYCRCIDTGCGFGGMLTAMDVRSGHCWQVSESGERVVSS